MALAIYEGSCLCGTVRYRASGPPYNITHCHCTMCRRATGAPFVSWATFYTERFRFVSGHPASFDSSENATRTFCARCGTPLTFQNAATPDEIDVTLGSLDHPEAVVPQDHTFVSGQLPWIKLADGLPRYEESRPG